ncbi:class I SAM-dependent methyltransferase [[Eubacterium] cellulosolvens]
MNDYEFKQVDFDNPSLMFRFEDKLKSALGGRFLYNPYFRTFGLKGDEKVLDFGCGGGVGSKCILKFLNGNGHVTCVDVSSYWVKRAEKRLEKFPNVDCRQGDIRKLSIPDSSFDVIFIVHVLHDIAPVERQSIVAALSRKLKQGGRLFIREPIRRSHGMPISEIRALLSGVGLKEVNHQKHKSEYAGEFHKT